MKIDPIAEEAGVARLYGFLYHTHKRSVSNHRCFFVSSRKSSLGTKLKVLVIDKRYVFVDLDKSFKSLEDGLLVVIKQNLDS